MKTTLSITCLLLSMLLPSCTKVIEVNLNDSSPKYVIQADLFADSNYASVSISQSKNFSENNSFTVIQNAIVTIQDDLGKIDTLSLSNNGLYESVAVSGKQNRTYTLTVRIGNSIFSAVSTIPVPVQLNSVKVDSLSGFGGRNNRITLTPKFNDPLGTRNNYRFVIRKNNELQEYILVQNDLLNDGIENSRPLNVRDLKFNTNDTLMVEMQCIDDGVYDYFQSLSQLTGNGQGSATPVNPLTNIKGGALGYFSAHTSQVVTIIKK